MESNRQGTGSAALLPPGAKPMRYETFLRENPAIGYLKIQASRAQGAIPSGGVRIVVAQNFEDARVLFFDGVTDENGIISGIRLPAPPRAASLDAKQPGRGASYQVYASHPNFEPGLYEVEIFEGITAILPVTLRLKKEAAQ